MIKLNRNHKVNKGGGFIFRMLVFLGIIAGLFFLFDINGSIFDSSEPEIEIKNEFMLPTGGDGQIVQHRYYTLSYIEEHEQAEWVVYELLRDQLKVKNVKRTNNFREDPMVKTGSSSRYDFGNPKYDRGHLAPAGDMAFNTTAMSQSFFMSNIAPQRRGFNQGIWRELEENTRNWANVFKRLVVVSGPILSEPIIEKIGNNRVSVPAAFFKVLLDIDDPEKKGIGFVIPNAVSDKHLREYAVSIDEVEDITGLDFYDNLVEDTLEEDLESAFDISLWRFSPKKYDLRVQKWNPVGR